MCAYISKMKSYYSCCFVIYFFHSSYTWWKISKTLNSGGHSSELKSALQKEPSGLFTIFFMADLRHSIVTYSGVACALHRGQRNIWELKVSLLQSSGRTPWHSYNIQEGGLCAGLIASLWLAMETLEPESLLLSNTGASKSTQSRRHPSAMSVPDLCPMPQSTGSNHGIHRAGSKECVPS